MKVILLQDIQGTGKKDQILEVSDGYARNFLFPRKLAKEASATNLNAIKMAKSAQEHKRQTEREEAVKLSAKMAEMTVQVPGKAGSAGRLFGAITAQEIADALARTQGIKIDKRKIVLRDPIKTLGEHEVDIKLFAEVTARLKINIVSDQV